MRGFHDYMSFHVVKFGNEFGKPDIRKNRVPEFYFLFVAIIMAAACVASTIRKGCVYVPECPSKNNDTYTVHVPYKDDCHKFYKCNQKCGYLIECPKIENTGERLVFNPDAQVCDWPTENNTCSDITAETTKVPSTNPVTTQPCTDCGLLDLCLKHQSAKKMVHETDCHKYFICLEGEKITASCEENKVFNPATKTCEEDPTGTKCCVSGRLADC